jgi:hypothetical protein
MYASEPQVRSLTRNKRSGMTLVELEAIGATIDAEIDARLSALFHWPVTVSGDPLNEPPPALIVSAASYLTAALIEMEAYGRRGTEPLRPHSGEAGRGAAAAYRAGRVDHPKIGTRAADGERSGAQDSQPGAWLRERSTNQ